VSGGSTNDSVSVAELVIRNASSAFRLEAPLEVSGRIPVADDAVLVGSRAAPDRIRIDGAVARERGGDSNGIWGRRSE
jgi:hypothetical protein